MKQEIFETKLVLHIPHYAWINDEITKINYHLFKELLTRHLAMKNILAWNISLSTGCYKGRDYEQELLTVFCHADVAKDIIAIFYDVYNANNNIMHQESFAYEYNSKLIVVNLGI